MYRGDGRERLIAMLVVRPVEIDDVDQVFDMIQDAELGLSTLAISKELLADRVEESVRVFSKSSAKPNGQPYVFVMEDTAHAKVVGTSAIYSKVGGFQPFYSYKVKSVTKKSEDLGVEKEIQYLDLHTTHSGPTEIGSLFLSLDYQGGGHGRLLSLARFMFMADFLERFEDETIAEMRGVVNQDGRSPLWDALGSHFFQIGYPRAETQTLENKKFIAELMPRHPIYVPLLPKEAQDVLAEVHAKTIPAKAMLEQEGFAYNNFVDIFDGGPTLQVDTAKIRSIADSQVFQITEITEITEIAGIDENATDQTKPAQYLLGNQRLDFRATIGRLLVNGDTAIIDEATASRLNLKVGDSVRAVAPRKPRPQSEA